jgi:hypothetical protein
LKLADKHLASKIHCVDDEIIRGWSGVSDAGATVMSVFGQPGK